MESESLTAVDGADLFAVPNGREEPQTLDADDRSEEDDDNAVKLLRQEIQGLKENRSKLQAKLDAAHAEFEQSEASKKMLAAHVSFLEGELMRCQEDLTAASSVAEEAEAEAKALRRSVQDLQAEKALLETSHASLESRIRDLEGRVAGYAALEGDIASEREKAAAADSKGEEEISILGLKVRNLEDQVRVSKEEKEIVVGEARRRAARNDELEEALKELVKTNAELEGKIGEFAHSNRDVAVDQKGCGGEAKELTVSWAMAAALAASIATVAAAITVFSIKAKQR